MSEHRFEIHKDKTLKEATEEAYLLCSLYDHSVALEDVRLVKYDDYHETIERFEHESYIIELSHELFASTVV